MRQRLQHVARRRKGSSCAQLVSAIATGASLVPKIVTVSVAVRRRRAVRRRVGEHFVDQRLAVIQRLHRRIGRRVLRCVYRM